MYLACLKTVATRAKGNRYILVKIAKMCLNQKLRKATKKSKQSRAAAATYIGLRMHYTTNYLSISLPIDMCFKELEPHKLNRLANWPNIKCCSQDLVHDWHKGDDHKKVQRTKLKFRKRSYPAKCKHKIPLHKLIDWLKKLFNGLIEEIDKKGLGWCWWPVF